MFSKTGFRINKNQYACSQNNSKRFELNSLFHSERHFGTAGLQGLSSKALRFPHLRTKSVDDSPDIFLEASKW